MEELFNFNTNWNNKLNCNYYTTLRMTDRHKVGDKGIISLKHQPQHIGEIIAKNPIRLFQDPSPYLDCIAYLDTGYNWRETVGIIKKMYSLDSVAGKTIYQYMIKNTRETIPEPKLL
jgi:hypothetical protein